MRAPRREAASCIAAAAQSSPAGCQSRRVHRASDRCDARSAIRESARPGLGTADIVTKRGPNPRISSVVSLCSASKFDV